MNPRTTHFAFGSRTDREDAAFVDRVISFSAQGKLWTLVVEQAQTTRYLKKANERYLRTKVMFGAGAPPLEMQGFLMPARVPARVTFVRCDGEECEVVLAASLEAAVKMAAA